MIEFKAANKPRIALMLDGSVEVTFKTTRAAISGLEGLKDKELSISVKEYAPRRSLSQNAYMWALINQLALKLDLSKEAVYRSYIKDYGVYYIIPIKEEAANAFISQWTKKGLGWYVERLGGSKLKSFENLAAYVGSSAYTTIEMKRVINAIIYDCNEQGIKTMTPEEILKLPNDND